MNKSLILHEWGIHSGCVSATQLPDFMKTLGTDELKFLLFEIRQKYTN